MNKAPEQFILRSEAMRVIRSGHAFDMEYVEADRRRGTGGELKSVKNWLIVNKGNDSSTAADQPMSRKTAQKKNPDHYKHKTFNIFNPKDRKQHAVKVHYRLILSLNGKRVING